MLTENLKICYIFTKNGNHNTNNDNINCNMNKINYSFQHNINGITNPASTNKTTEAILDVRNLI